jgi:hypothetical protein
MTPASHGRTRTGTTPSHGPIMILSLTVTGRTVTESIIR